MITRTPTNAAEREQELRRMNSKYTDVDCACNLCFLFRQLDAARQPKDPYGRSADA